MRKAAVTMLVLAFGIFFAATALADSATKEECVAKTKAAAQTILNKGLDEAVKKSDEILKEFASMYK